MPDHSTFLAAILANPDDDAPRLVYADWLEEHGDPRGEFIRTQCELATLPDRCEKQRYTLRQHVTLPSSSQAYIVEWYECFWRAHNNHYKNNKTHQRVLLPEDEWNCDPCRRCQMLKLQSDLFHADQNIVPLGESLQRLIKNNLCQVAVLRGFAGEAICGWDIWRVHADTILAEHPVRQVRLTTNPPLEIAHSPLRYRLSGVEEKGAYFLPSDIKASHRMLGGYPFSFLPPHVGRYATYTLLRRRWPYIRIWKFMRRNPYADLPMARTRRDPVLGALTSVRRDPFLPSLFMPPGSILRDTGQLR